MVADSCEDVLISVDLCTIWAGSTWYGIPTVSTPVCSTQSTFPSCWGAESTQGCPFPWLPPSGTRGAVSLPPSCQQVEGLTLSLYHNASEKSDKYGKNWCAGSLYSGNQSSIIILSFFVCLFDCYT